MLNCAEKCKKTGIFYGFWATPGFRACDVTHYQKFQIFWFGWTPNAPMIPKMYNIVGIWPTDQELLSWKPIAVFGWNEKKEEKN